MKAMEQRNGAGKKREREMMKADTRENNEVVLVKKWKYKIYL